MTDNSGKMVAVVLPQGQEPTEGESDAEFWLPLLKEHNDDLSGLIREKEEGAEMTDFKSLGSALDDLAGTLTATTQKASGIPPISKEIRESNSPQEVAERIQSTWLGYGVSDLSDVDDGVQMSITKGEQGGEPIDDDTFKNAMKYLWYKPSGDESESGMTYKMTGSDFPVRVEFGDKITVTVMNA